MVGSWLAAESMMWVMETSARIVAGVSAGRRLGCLSAGCWCRARLVPGISPMGSERNQAAQLADRLNGEFFVSCPGLPPALLVWTQIRWLKAWRGSP